MSDPSAIPNYADPGRTLVPRRFPARFLLLLLLPLSRLLSGLPAVCCTICMSLFSSFFLLRLKRTDGSNLNARALLLFTCRCWS